MFVFEIMTPGTWLDYEDNDWSWKIQNLLESLKSQFFEANTALNLFINVQACRSSFANRVKIEQDQQRCYEIQRSVEQERGGHASHKNWDEIHLEAEVIFKREKWSKGEVPREFESNLPFLYARAFLYALNAFDKFLEVLSKEDRVPEQLLKFYQQFSETFSCLRGVRNTSQHLEDRARGLGAGRNPQPLDLKPIENRLVNAPRGGVLILNSLNGSRFGSTMADGHYGEVDVSVESMQNLQQILDGVLQSFNWRGPKQHSPNA